MSTTGETCVEVDTSAGIVATCGTASVAAGEAVNEGAISAVLASVALGSLVGLGAAAKAASCIHSHSSSLNPTWQNQPLLVAVGMLGFVGEGLLEPHAKSVLSTARNNKGFMSWVLCLSG